MDFVIWGAGLRGNAIIRVIGREYFCAIIDSDKKKIGMSLFGIPVISIEEYIAKYSEKIVIVSTHEDDIIAFLKSHGIEHFFNYRECPGELQYPYPAKFKDIFRNTILSTLSKDKTNIVCGDSFFSLVLYDWIRSEDYKVKLYNKNIFNKSIEILLDSMGKYDCIDYLMDDAELLVSTMEVPNIVGFNVPYKNMFFLSNYTDQYNDIMILQYKNQCRHRRRCFIIGNGPSLTIKDLDLLHSLGEACIGMNRIYEVYGQTAWRPDYYIALDANMLRFLQKNTKDFYELKKSVCFLSDEIYDAVEGDCYDRVVKVHYCGTCPKGGEPFSEDISRIIYAIATVTYGAIELAVYLGFSDIYLLGVDATGINDKYIKYGHFYNEERLCATCNAKYVKEDYKAAKRYIDTHRDVRIYNATRGGELEFFERVEFDDLFDK